MKAKLFCLAMAILIFAIAHAKGQESSTITGSESTVDVETLVDNAVTQVKRDLQMDISKVRAQNQKLANELEISRRVAEAKSSAPAQVQPVVVKIEGLERKTNDDFSFKPYVIGGLVLLTIVFAGAAVISDKKKRNVEAQVTGQPSFISQPSVVSQSEPDKAKTEPVVWIIEKAINGEYRGVNMVGICPICNEEILGMNFLRHLSRTHLDLLPEKK